MNIVLREEKKYLIHKADFYRMSGMLERIMLQDSHNGSLGYPIRSLYFDTPFEGDYEDKLGGFEVRKKIRLRCYDPGDTFAMLEMKQKQGAQQKKRSLRMRREDASKLCQGDYSALLQYPEPFAAECYGLMNTLCYRPKTVVEYRRKAFVAKENKIRVTFDSDIRATESCYDLFSSQLAMYPVLDDFNMVLEVKFNGFLLSYIQNLLALADRSQLSVSKYCLARSASMHYNF